MDSYLDPSVFTPNQITIRTLRTSFGSPRSRCRVKEPNTTTEEEEKQHNKSRKRRWWWVTSIDKGPIGVGQWKD